jgi:hypothetical protein
MLESQVRFKQNDVSDRARRKHLNQARLFVVVERTNGLSQNSSQIANASFVLIIREFIVACRRANKTEPYDGSLTHARFVFPTPGSPRQSTSWLFDSGDNQLAIPSRSRNHVPVPGALRALMSLCFCRVDRGQSQSSISVVRCSTRNEMSAQS